MPDNKDSGIFVILGRRGYFPVGINPPKDPAPYTLVHVNPPVPKWVLNEDDNGKFRLSIGEFPYTGVMGGNITPSKNPEDDVAWEFIYHESQDAYTIVRADDTSMGWSPDDDFLNLIQLRQITMMRHDPSKISETHLFVLQKPKL